MPYQATAQHNTELPDELLSSSPLPVLQGVVCGVAFSQARSSLPLKQRVRNEPKHIGRLLFHLLDPFFQTLILNDGLNARGIHDSGGLQTNGELRSINTGSLCAEA